jgi:hypothetical protein
VDWPISNVPQMIQTATLYMRKKWQPDAVPVQFSAALSGNGSNVAGMVHSDEGDVVVTFVFFSRTARQSATLMPRFIAGTLSVGEAGSESYPIREPILDLPAAVARLGNPRIRKAVLGWSEGPQCGTGNFFRDNAILPPCGNRKKVVGIQWEIETPQDNYWIPASGR